MNGGAPKTGQYTGSVDAALGVRGVEHQRLR